MGGKHTKHGGPSTSKMKEITNFLEARGYANVKVHIFDYIDTDTVDEDK
jgi:hypothetical protein